MNLQEQEAAPSLSFVRPNFVFQRDPLYSPAGKDEKLTATSDDLLVQDLNRLSVEEREHVYHEIHGVAAPLEEESPEFVEKTCQQLLQALGEQPKSRRAAYDRALFLRPSLATDVKFQLMFLRADRYDVAAAAIRMCAYYTKKLEFFGDELLVNHITQSDLSEDDMHIMESGLFTVLQETDQSGRVVYFFDLNLLPSKWHKNVVRYGWYMLMTLCIQENVQRRGLVEIIYAGGLAVFPTPEFYDLTIITNQMATTWLPVRWAAKHICFDIPSLAKSLSLFQLLIGSRNRVRFRCHSGSGIEMQYSLLTYGIRLPFCMTQLPPSEERQQLANDHLRKQALMEVQNTQREKHSLVGVDTLYPGPKDVLLGRGSPYHACPGNKYMLALVEAETGRYKKATLEYLGKKAIAIGIVQRIQSEGGHFLERTDLGWKYAGQEKAVEKISRALRRRAAQPTTRASSAATLKIKETNDETNDGDNENAVWQSSTNPFAPVGDGFAQLQLQI